MPFYWFIYPRYKHTRVSNKKVKKTLSGIQKLSTFATYVLK
jgi:hypothetical protein